MFYQTYTARKLPSACTAVTPSPPAATQWRRLLMRAVYGARLTTHCQWDDSTVFRFFCPW